MHEYTCAVVSVLILCFFLVLRIFWEEQLSEQFWYGEKHLYFNTVTVTIKSTKMEL